MTDLIASAGKDMKADWNARALSDPLYYIVTYPGAKDIRIFNITGLESANAVMSRLWPFLKCHDTVLDIGCGIGRVLQFIAPCFTNAYGIDVSDEYIKQSKDFLKHIGNANTLISDGKSIPSEISDNSIDLAYSTLVFDHIPIYEDALSLTQDIYRVLKPGGLVVLHIAVADHVWFPNIFTNTWKGVRWTKQSVDRMITDAKLKIIHNDTREMADNEHVRNYWVISEKCLGL